MKTGRGFRSLVGSNPTLSAMSRQSPPPCGAPSDLSATSRRPVRFIVMTEPNRDLGGCSPPHSDQTHTSLLSEIGAVAVVYGALVAVPILIAIVR